MDVVCLKIKNVANQHQNQNPDANQDPSQNRDHVQDRNHHKEFMKNRSM